MALWLLQENPLLSTSIGMFIPGSAGFPDPLASRLIGSGGRGADGGGCCCAVEPKEGGGGGGFGAELDDENEDEEEMEFMREAALGS